MSDVRLLHALERIREDLPTLCGERWPHLQQRLAELLDAYARAADDEERARISLEIQDEIERASPEAALRLYREMEQVPRATAFSAEDFNPLRAYFPPPGTTPVPPLLFICPEEDCIHQEWSVDPNYAGECPKHRVPLVRADGPHGTGASEDTEV